MKTESIASILACISLGLTCLPAAAQSYSVEWFTIDGGGGTSTGGVYSISGTIGQPDAGPTSLSGGPYSITGGFWSLFVAVQTPEAPLLRIEPAVAGQVRISWEPAGGGFILQQSPTLSSPAWADAPSGTANPVLVPLDGQTRFYRLVHP